MADKPRDKGLKDYAKDFLGGILGRKDTPKQRQEPSEKRDDGILGGFGTSIREKAEEMRAKAAAEHAKQMAERAKAAAEQAQAEAKRQQQGQSTRPQAQTPARPESQAPRGPSGSSSRPEEALSESLRGGAKTGSQAAEQSREVGGTSRRTYTVVYGDSLSKIAQRYYGDMMQWKRIYEANRDKISNPDLIHPGQELVIPE